MRLESWLLHWWNKSSACVRYQASASGSRAEDQPLRPTSVAGDVDACAAWPTAPLSPERSARLAAVAEHWLRPLRSRAAADRAAGRPAAAWELAERVGAACPLVMVRSSQIYVHIPGAPPRWAAWAVGDRPSTLRQHVSLRRCGQQGQQGQPLQGDGGSSDARGGAVDWLDGQATRLVTLLRLLRRALLSDDGAQPPPWPAAFSFRLCLDDLCPSDAADDQQGASASSHGGGNTTTTTTTTAATTTTNASLFRTSVLLDAPLPLLSMVACGGAARASSIPVPQWMATGVAAEHNASAKQWYGSVGGTRDVDLSMWRDDLLRRRRLRAANDERWGCRKPLAVWRGTVHVEHGSVNLGWGDDKLPCGAKCALRRRPITRHRWREQGRFALLHQKCEHPYLLDVRAKVTRGTSDSHGAWAQSGLSSNGSGFLECARRAEADAPKYMSMEEQARRFQIMFQIKTSATQPQPQPQP